MSKNTTNDQIDTYTYGIKAYNKDATATASTSALEHWEPSTCLCPKCGSQHTSVNTMCVLTSYPEQYNYKCRDCGNRWTGFAHYGIPPMKTWPDLEGDVIAIPDSNYGWICPKCNSVYAPGVTECKRCATPWYPTITCQGDISGGTNLAPNSVTGGSNIATTGEIRMEDYQAWYDKSKNVLKYESFKKQHGE